MTTAANVPSAVIVLAAGAGTRMKSATPKVMHPIGGRSMVEHAVAVAGELDPKNLAVVVRHQRDKVAEHVSAFDSAATIVDQDDIPGTGRAVEVGLLGLDAEGSEVEGTVVVTYGDVPLLKTETLRKLIAFHEEGKNAVTVLTTNLDQPGSYGRIVRNEAGEVTAIVEAKDATPEQLAITEINSGIYAFDAKVLRDSLTRVTTDNAQGEKYITDVLAIARQDGFRTLALDIDDRWEVEGANDRVQLAQLGRKLNERLTEMHMRNGVTIVDPESTWIDVTVTIENDVTILPGTHLQGTTHIATGSVVGPDTTLKNVKVGENVKISRTEGSDSEIAADATVGPFAYLRPGTKLGVKGKIGTFVETKNTEIGNGSKLPHLSYAGDVTIGENSNIGAASVFVNYDGVNKHRSIVGNNVRMGSDNMYVAPVNVGDGAYSGAGTVIRKDVPAGALAINEAPQRNIERWVIEKRAGTEAAEAALAAEAKGSASSAKESDNQ
ncbi:bifunctional UDP-N-acetylglucosamine diphosphorylase/glucosamine-1-phosphate N-acetyltransferase GlmU [Rothia terrae]|uniref:bifunctional UDP-N-acetylglucosamine diphosphorylase/glucosamine-1-phosphate N-acetyltransferase GlmU n=1 Tax=Rothia terrae TaxID=396015 RepID=UPI0028820D52|nr:bifunctional UDP-N-acetylglucosamine diphosphorylase/glucosamine-1-phosphate N-acetyltransferase GlmU [Rothia terrae]MDT0190355.1 bifunctional UDP-N-acetylglucosamine diphosphorylase/glucosamine-1-phosphate N-acetyltransferase GlmU [Rothia terrae]